MEQYRTVTEQGSDEIVIQKSKFIAYASPAESREEAEEFIRTIRKKHYNATHNVPAMVIGDQFQLQWGSDDGEPQGTSGAPIVQMLVKERFSNLVIVVTRYFGGIKLGTGGLVRAYTQAAKAGLRASSPAAMTDKLAVSFATDYSTFNRISAFPFDGKAEISNIQYTDKVAFDLYLEESDREDVLQVMAGLTNGSIHPLKEEHKLFALPLDPESL
ncbi:MAG: YigZ family protein [Eubacterium sp.]